MGSISAALSFPVLAPPWEESLGMGREEGTRAHIPEQMSNTSQGEVCKGSGTISANPPAIFSPTCLKFFRGRKTHFPQH